MMKRKFKKRILISVIFVSGLLLALFYLTTPVIGYFSNLTYKFSNHVYSANLNLKMNSIYSGSLKKDLQNFIKNWIQKRGAEKINFMEFNKNLNKNFPVIKKLVWDLSFPDLLTLSILGSKPFCIVNKKFILTKENILLDKLYFKDFNLDGLNQLFIYNDVPKTLEPEFFVFLKFILKMVGDQYNIKYKNYSEIFLEPKDKQSNYCLLVKLESSLPSDKVYKARQIAKKNSKRNCKWIFDLRFKNRIILKQENI